MMSLLTAGGKYEGSFVHFFNEAAKLFRSAAIPLLLLPLLPVFVPPVPLYWRIVLSIVLFAAYVLLKPFHMRLLYNRTYKMLNPVSFIITEQSLTNMKSEGVPDDVLAKLESIKNREVICEANFQRLLNDTIGEEQTVKFKSVILKHALNPNESSKKPCEPKYATADLDNGIRLFFWDGRLVASAQVVSSAPGQPGRLVTP